MTKGRFVFFVLVVTLLAVLSLTMRSQTVNMGRTYISSQNVRYANEGGTGTTLNKLAKLTGAPSTAIITATVDTSGIIGIVVAGAGAAGNADIAFSGKALCVFDSATTAGHYVQNDTSTAGDCMDTGAATYPTSGQVIGIVTSTNGGAGTYEVDLTIGQAQAGGAGGGATISSGTYAALPAVCTAGNAYLPTDSFYSILRCGAANVWTPWGPGFPGVLHDDTGFAWDNQDTATVDTSYGGVYISTTANNTTEEYVRYKAKAGNYKITVLVLMHLNRANYNAFDIGWRQSSDGKLASFSYYHNSAFNLETTKWNTSTSFNSGYSSIAAPDVQWLFMQIEANASNRVCRWGIDGQHFSQVHSVGRTDFLTPDQVYYAIRSQSASFGAGATIISWKEEAI